jgi:predicted RNA-binding protein
MKNIKIISATKESNSFKTLIYPFINYYKMDALVNRSICDGDIITNNTESLAKVYNKFINKDNENIILVFCHDDLLIEDNAIIEKLNEAIKHYDIIGLAGVKPPITIKEPALWHLMGNRQNLSGAVAHFDKNSDNKRFMTSFGPIPERVILLDGVFLAINTEKILEKDLKFDENNPAKFHFYDLHFCLDANKLGLKCGTWPIWCTHKSHGLEQVSQDWLEGQKYFLNKWS